METCPVGRILLKLCCVIVFVGDTVYDISQLLLLPALEFQHSELRKKLQLSHMHAWSVLAC